MRLMILEQKYLEMLEDGQHHEALDCLRNQVTPLKPKTEHVRKMSSSAFRLSHLLFKEQNEPQGNYSSVLQRLYDLCTMACCAGLNSQAISQVISVNQYAFNYTRVDTIRACALRVGLYYWETLLSQCLLGYMINV